MSRGVCEASLQEEGTGSNLQGIGSEGLFAGVGKSQHTDWYVGSCTP